MKEQGSILAALFDPTMERTVTRRVIGVLYMISLPVWTAVVTAGVLSVHSVTDGQLTVLAVVVAPLLWTLGLFVLRIRAERIAVLFRIAEYTRPGVPEPPERHPELV
jgi:hypothetical protein